MEKSKLALWANLRTSSVVVAKTVFVVKLASSQ